MRANEAYFESPSQGEIPARDTTSAVRVQTGSRLRASKALFLFAAGISFLLSVYLWFLVDRDQGLFVGIWVPSILSLGALLLANPGADR